MAPIAHQLILFGPPGTSKSHSARAHKAKALGVDFSDNDDKDRLVPVTFHPDYSYGEFVARLLPRTRDGQIEYRVHAGPFLRALAQAYMYQLIGSNGHELHNVVLLVDEINRGNCAEIFGDVFQLLDRDGQGWSSYEIGVSDLVLEALEAELERLLYPNPFPELPTRIAQCLARRQLVLPPNLFMIGTMNTSDESIYFMDSAFKRRWHFEFCPEGFAQVPADQRNALLPGPRMLTWETFLDALNQFIRERCTAPRLDDRLVGPWFVKARRRSKSLAQARPDDLAALWAIAGEVGRHGIGVQRSKDFDACLESLLDTLSAGDKRELLLLGGYDDAEKLKFTSIRYDLTRTRPFYCSKHSSQKFVSDDSGLVIEDYLDELGAFELDEQSWYIDQGEIVGKLFLYLWDNVFDRDKSPLCQLLQLEPLELRTFGQFVAQADRFIERLCPQVAASSLPEALEEA